MSSGPMKSTDKRRAGHGNNVGISASLDRGNGRAKANANEFKIGRNGAAKRSI